MKRKALGIFATSALLVLGSCTKEYTCDCDVNTFDAGGNLIATGGETLTKNYKSKSDADTWCANRASQINALPYKSATCVVQ